MTPVFIIVTRNPSNGKVVIVSDGDRPDDAAQFEAEGEAEAAAANTTVCKAWGYQVVEID